MQDTCSITIIARLVKDPEMRSLVSGTSVLSMRVAWNQSKKVGDSYEDVPGFIDVSYFGRAAEAIQQYATKGKQIAITGRLQYREWESENGRRTAYDILAERVQLLGGRSSDEPGRQDSLHPGVHGGPASTETHNSPAPF